MYKNVSYFSFRQLSIGRLEDAARTLARRSDPGSLFLSAKLYEQAENESLANSIGLLALKEACLRHDHIKIEPFLSHLPKLTVSMLLLTCINIIYIPFPCSQHTKQYSLNLI